MKLYYRLNHAARIGVVAASIALSGCSASSRQSSAELSNLRPIDVCRAADGPVGIRVLVQGEFDGTDFATRSTIIMLASAGICNDRGAGLVFATVRGREEMDKIAQASPRGKRSPFRPGTILAIEGTVTKIDERRFIYLDDAVVR